MATINTVDDLIEVLKGEDKVRFAVWRELLTHELLPLPYRFGTMVEVQTAMLQTQESILENIEETCEEQKAKRETHETDRLDYMRVINWIRDNDALDAATKYKARIAKHFARIRNMRQFRCVVLSPEDVDDLVAEASETLTDAGFSDDDIDFTSEADLVAAVKRRRQSEPEFYIVVEASYTGHSNDVDRAIVRAQIIGAATKCDAYAVVASVHLSDGVEARAVGDAKEYLASADRNIAFWHELVEEEVWH